MRECQRVCSYAARFKNTTAGPKKWVRSQRAAADGAAAAKQTRASRTCPLSTGPQSERERPKTSPSHWPPINPPIDKYNIIRGCVYQKSRGGESGDFNAGFCSRKEAPTNSSALRFASPSAPYHTRNVPDGNLSRFLRSAIQVDRPEIACIAHGAIISALVRYRRCELFRRRTQSANTRAQKATGGWRNNLFLRFLFLPDREY